jgi:hypothetical protein
LIKPFLSRFRTDLTITAPVAWICGFKTPSHPHPAVVKQSGQRLLPDVLISLPEMRLIGGEGESADMIPISFKSIYAVEKEDGISEVVGIPKSGRN